MRAAVAFACIAFALFSYAQSRTSEYAIKAAYLFNFGKFVRFEPAATVENRQSFDICVLGDDPIEPALKQLTQNEQLDGKPVQVVRPKSAMEARTCAIAYISPSEGDRIDHDVEALDGRGVLTVSDAPKFLQHGGMIQFVMVGNHVRFSVNLDSVRRAQISLSSELLRVAESTTGDPSAGVRP